MGKKEGLKLVVRNDVKDVMDEGESVGEMGRVVDIGGVLVN